ncbi:hypothetical protein CAPTEDRAFT_226413 [Capitella teleta]|uniref:28S ribosomal protein S27, mitochondrial n=1 Tax=Capitella teleta TaxID=283909 RepID=R7VJ96_CAPTE|nr:hypothetical protein CAPTEDRAFT_226413 [Capitella teleta]|eukprot:ELU18637.1 hypothetical protein CAPTEDRAFT_226413 [Capitella teleta]
MASCGLRRLVLQQKHFKTFLSYSARRTLLSEAYSCNDAWQRRLQDPVLLKVDAGSFGVKLQEQFDIVGRVSAIDMDIFANKLIELDVVQLDFAQQLFQRFRRTDETVRMLESTPHALIRTLLDLKEYSRLMTMLKDKIGYGIFLDDISANLLMDHFIKRNMFKEAACIAFDLMLQEDWSHPLSRRLAWYACHLRLQQLQASPEEQTEGADEDEEEMQYVKVKYILTPWYDDHFDLNKETQLLGKTLVSITRQETGTLALSYQLIGWGLYEKFEQGLALLQTLVGGTEAGSVSANALKLFSEALKNIETKEKPEQEKSAGELTLEDVRPYITQDQKEAYIQQLEELLPQLDSSARVNEQFMEGEALFALTQTTVEKMEAIDVEDQNAMFKEWSQRRQDMLDAQIQAARTKRKKEEIVNRLLALKDQEERLSYFDQNDQITVGMSKAPSYKSLDMIQDEEQFVAAPGERQRKK